MPRGVFDSWGQDFRSLLASIGFAARFGLKPTRMDVGLHENFASLDTRPQIRTHPMPVLRGDISGKRNPVLCRNRVCFVSCLQMAGRSRLVRTDC